MDKLSRSRLIVKQTLQARADLMRGQPLAGEEIVCLLDEATDNYVLLRLGWLQGTRLYSVTVHVRLIGDKVHIEQDWTDDFVSDLLDAGISPQDVVPAGIPTLPRGQNALAAVA